MALRTNVNIIHVKVSKSSPAKASKSLFSLKLQFGVIDGATAMYWVIISNKLSWIHE